MIDKMDGIGIVSGIECSGANGWIIKTIATPVEYISVKCDFHISSGTFLSEPANKSSCICSGNLVLLAAVLSAGRQPGY